MSLLIVVPFAKSDLPVNEAYLALMEHFAGIEKNNVVVVARKEMEPEAVATADRLRKLAKSCTLHIVGDFPQSWPAGPNDMFLRTVHYLRDTKNEEPWLWMEQDAPPIAAGWAGELMGSHNESGKPFTGRTLDAIDCYDGPKTKQALEDYDGKLMNGVGIYPPDFHLHSQLYKAANREKPPVPFDLYCRWEIAPHCNHTDLIVGVKRATNLKRIEGGFSYTSRGEEKTVQIGNAVLLHSCKDASLAEAITGRKVAVPVERVEKVEEEGGDETAPPTEPSVIIAQVDALVPRDGKSIRIGELVKQIGMKRSQLEIVLVGSGQFTVKAPGWVQRRAA